MGVSEKLLAIQEELKAPKGQYNSFGKYNYRSCEDILEAVKPLLAKNKATLVISDSLEMVGDRIYVKATAKFTDIESGESIENAAFARESIDKRGMDDSQVTGATSSYARKYALNGLFLIDDTKDADTDEYMQQQNKSSSKTSTKKADKTDEEKNEEMKASVDKDLIPEANKPITASQLKKLQAEMDRTGVSLKQVLSIAQADSLDKIKQTTFSHLMTKFAKTKDKA